MKKKFFQKKGSKEKQKQSSVSCAFCKKTLPEAEGVIMGGKHLHQECIVQWRRLLKGGKAGSKPVETSPVDQYDMLESLGSGAFAIVYKAREKLTKEIYAIKVIKKQGLNADAIEAVRRERDIMHQAVGGPFLASLHKEFEDSKNTYLVMECADAGDLFDLIQDSCEDGIGRELTHVFAAQILLGVEFLHFIGVVYRDLKPENILLMTDGRVLLTDFGISKDGLNSLDSRTQTFCGTSIYLAPEVLLGQPYGRTVDWWSFGCVIYEMLSGMPPFYSEDLSQMTRAILRDDPDYPDAWLDEEVLLLMDLLQKKPENRCSDADSVRGYAFFQAVDWQTLKTGKVPPRYKELALQKGVSSKVSVGTPHQQLVAKAGSENAFADFDFESEAHESTDAAEAGDAALAALHSLHIGDMLDDLDDVEVFESWEGDESEEMTIHEGEIVTVLERGDDGWWVGQIGDRQGYFPSSFVQSRSTNVTPRE